MDMTMSIAATSVMMSQQQMQQSYDVSLMKEAMYNQTQQALSLVKDMAQSAPVRFGAPGSLLNVLA